MADQWKSKLEPVFPSWMLFKLGQAIKDERIEGHGPFHSIEYHTTANGSRRVFRDVSNGQDYEVIVNVLPAPVIQTPEQDNQKKQSKSKGWYKKSSLNKID